MPADRPLSLPAWAVRAVRDGLKTRHSVIMTPSNTLFNGGPWSALHKAQEWDWAGAWVDEGPSPAGNAGPYLKLPWAGGDDAPFAGTVHRIYPRWQIGDRLWVREAWRTWAHRDHVSARDVADDLGLAYDCDGLSDTWRGRKRHALHMPRWASRMTLTVTGLAVQRVQDITEDDATAEGVDALPPFMSDGGGATCTSADVTYRNGFRAIMGDAWDRNDWVAAATFTARMGNIDEAPE